MSVVVILVCFASPPAGARLGRGCDEALDECSNCSNSLRAVVRKLITPWRIQAFYRFIAEMS